MTYEQKTKPDFLKIQDVAEMLSVSRATIDRWHRDDPNFPRKISFSGACARFIRLEVEQWIDLAKKRSTGNG